MAEFVYNLTRSKIKAELAGAGQNARIVYSIHTTWWRHRNEPRFRTNDERKLPVDPLGAPLLQIDGFTTCLGWIDAAYDQAERYGRHGFMAFLAANAENCRNRHGGRAFAAFKDWDEANDAVDRYLARTKPPSTGR